MSIRLFPGYIKRWVDGDTVDINLDLGFKVWSVQRFRLSEINTPEKGQPGYLEALQRVNQLAPLDTQVLVSCKGYDRYGRWIADITPDHAVVSVNQMLLNENLAVRYTG